MNLNIGDLVKCRTHGQKIGIVVDKRLSNEGLTNSMHTRHLIKTYPLVYYIYFSGEGKLGPYHETEVSIQQYFKQERSSNDEF